MWKHLMLTILALSFRYTISQPDENANYEFYTAGVAEFGKDIPRDGDDYVEKNLALYIDFIEKAKDQHVDILVFPEGTLNYYLSNREIMLVQGFELPNPADKIAPWESSNSEILRALSKKIKESQIYVLINLIEKVPCGDSSTKKVTCKRHSKHGGYNLYNTNVIFDREGRVISTYRKHNLYEEPDVEVPDEAALATFTTDFGVKFGHFICFDILFKNPALTLLRKENIANILYPSYWFSDLPFLTGTQVHLGWAAANNINLISAGGNRPSIGVSGSGIFIGNKIAKILVDPTRTPRLLVAKVPKDPKNYNPDKLPATEQISLYSPIDMQNLKVAEEWTDLEVMKWNITLDDQPQRICIDTDLCCTFDIKIKELEIPAGKIAYNYKLVANYTTRFLETNRKSGEIYCAVLACTTQNPKSCGRHFKDNKNLFNAIEFDRISITANVKAPRDTDDVLIMPNTLHNTILPLDSNDYFFKKVPSIKETGLTYDRYKIESKHKLQNILTFGLYGRNFALDERVTKRKSH